MNADEKLALIMVKVERAKKHVVDLHGEIDAFLSTKPYTVVKNIDSKLGKVGYQISKITPTPRIIVAITGDAIQNLRSALDHLAYHLLVVRLGAAASDKYFNFPTPNTANDLERKIQSRLRQDAVDALRKLEPYKGGKGHQLWVLNRLNNIDKHRIIITVGSAFRSLNLGGSTMRTARRMAEKSGIFGPSFKAGDFPRVASFFRPADNMCPLKVGDVLPAIDMEMDEQNDFRFDIALNEPEIVERKPLIETVQHFADLVSNTVLEFKPCLS